MPTGNSGRRRQPSAFCSTEFFLHMGDDQHAPVPLLDRIEGNLGDDQRLAGTDRQDNDRVVVMLAEIGMTASTAAV